MTDDEGRSTGERLRRGGRPLSQGRGVLQRSAAFSCGLIGGAAVDVRIKLAFESVVEAEPIAPYCVTPQTSLREVFSVLEQNNGGALVCHEGMLVGIFTERD